MTGLESLAYFKGTYVDCLQNAIKESFECL